MVHRRKRIVPKRRIVLWNCNSFYVHFCCWYNKRTMGAAVSFVFPKFANPSSRQKYAQNKAKNTHKSCVTTSFALFHNGNLFIYQDFRIATMHTRHSDHGIYYATQLGERGTANCSVCSCILFWDMNFQNKFDLKALPKLISYKAHWCACAECSTLLTGISALSEFLCG